jgi:hypothetical protein
VREPKQADSTPAKKEHDKKDEKKDDKKDEKTQPAAAAADGAADTPKPEAAAGDAMAE